ncbi:MAG: DUF58 domain-containing protein [Bacillota bacterium]|nr:DUF58 domain-containing protein [Bacillota bacterium]
MLQIKKPVYIYGVILLGIIALMVGGKFPYLFFYISVLIFLFPYLWLSFSLRNLSGSIRVSSTHAEVGQFITVTYEIKNSRNGRFPYLELTDIIGQTFQVPTEKKFVSLNSEETIIVEKEVICSRRGRYDLKEFQVKTGDPFNFFQLSKPLATGEEIRVYPKLKILQGITPSAKQHFGNLAVQELYYESYSQISDLREWQYGDSVKKIHWKQSARQNRLIVKNFDHKGDATLNIFIDMRIKSFQHDNNYQLEDLAIETAASVLFTSLGNNMPVEVFSELISAGSLVGRHYNDYWDIMDTLITFSPKSKTDFSIYLVNQSFYLPPGSCLFLITPLINLQDAATFMSLKQKGYIINLFFLTFNELSKSERTILDRLNCTGVKVFVLNPSEVTEDGSRTI